MTDTPPIIDPAAAMPAADVVIGPVPPVAADETILVDWGNAVASRAVQRYRTLAERDAQPSSDGQMCYVAETGFLYLRYTGAWTALSAPFSKLFGAANNAFSAFAPTTDTAVSSVNIAAPVGLSLRCKVYAQQLFAVSSTCAVGDEWSWSLYVGGTARSRFRWIAPRAGAQNGSVNLAWFGTFTTAASPTAELRANRLTGTSTITGAADATLNATQVETSAGRPY